MILEGTVMRMRKKKNLESRQENVQSLLVQTELSGGHGEPFCGKQLELSALFPAEQPLEVEIGCGKGQFAVALAQRHPDVNFLAVEVCANVIVQACEKAQAAELSNLKFLRIDAEALSVLLPKHSVRRIYLNFSCPFPKKRQQKRRLTHERFLNIYKELLTPDGEIQQKTDNRVLFGFSIEEFSRCGFVLSEVSLDLHADEPEDNIVTEYEKRFTELGQPIYRLVARPKA